MISAFSLRREGNLGRVAAILALLVISVATLPANAAAPSVVLKDLNGKERNVNEFIGQGKWVVVEFWAHDCPICKAESYQMEFFNAEHQKKDAIVVGVSIDGWDKRALAKQFIDDQGLTFVNLIGTAQDVAAFGGGALVGTPTYYIFSPDGKLMAKNVGPVTQQDVEAFMAKADNYLTMIKRGAVNRKQQAATKQP
jgi:peroxiredoxin